MNWILNIDTSLETAFVILSKDGKIINNRTNENQKDHAAFLEPAIQSIIQKAGIGFTDLSAIAVVHGPGSYTGLRVGMASAKGLCFALNKPLILLNNLELLTIAAINENKKIDNASILYCPMIDARRMEAYTALYDENLHVVMEPQALILEEKVFDGYLTNHTIIFFGNGSKKWENLCSYKNARFIQINDKAAAINQCSFQMIAKQLFTPIAYAEPFYIKEFFTTSTISKDQ